MKLSFNEKEDAESILLMGKKYTKRPIPITAVQIQCAFEVKTLEGLMQGKKGDYLLEGVEGELYICNERIFKKTYKEVKEDANNKIKLRNRIK